MTLLLSTKNLNSLKQICINKGGYEKNKEVLLLACNLHLEMFGVDLTPKQLKNS